MNSKQDIIDRAKHLFFSNACNTGIDECVKQALTECGGVSKIISQKELQDIYTIFDIDENTYTANYIMQLIKEILKEITVDESK